MSSENSNRYQAAEAAHSAAIKLLRLVRMEDTKTGVGPAQLSALSVLVFNGPKRLNELAALEQVRPPTMSRIADGLVKQGLAQRQSQASDRRSVWVSATPAGKRILLQGKARRVRALTRRLATLSGHDIKIIGKAAKLLLEL